MADLVIPAQPGTSLYEYSEDAEPFPHPVFGWRIHNAKYNEPLMLAHKASEFPEWVVGIDGYFVSAKRKREYPTIDDWIADVLENPEAQPEEEPTYEGTIRFGKKKPYKLKSFWHFRDGDDQFLFEVEGGDPVPDDSRVTKVNRTEYAELRKDHDKISYSRIRSGIEEPKTSDELDDEAEDLL